MCLHSYKSRRENILKASILSSQNSYLKFTLIIPLDDRASQCYASGHAQNGFEQSLEPSAAAITIRGINWFLGPAYAAAVAFRVNGLYIFPSS